jgi:hypothetical protein
MVTTRLTIRELEFGEDVATQDTYLCEISRDGCLEIVPLNIPFDKNDEEDLRWFLESYPQSPFSSSRAEKISKRLDRYTSAIASQLASIDIFKGISNEDADIELLVEPLTEQPLLTGFHQIHWEALENPDAWAVSTFNSVRVVRQVKCAGSTGSTIDPGTALSFSDETFRILFVCARRSVDHSRDISSRIIMQPVFEVIDQVKTKNETTNTHVLRRATWATFQAMLKSKPRGWFTEVHFDCHGEVVQGTARLLFSPDSGDGSEKISASLVASALVEAGVSLANLNACSTAMASSRTVDENLAITFAQAGIPITIAMSYDILDMASCRFEEEFYRSWLLNSDEDQPKKLPLLSRLMGKTLSLSSSSRLSIDESVCLAVRDGRTALRDKGNRVGRGGWQVRLRDDIVPVVYVSKGLSAEVIALSPSNPPSQDLPKKTSRLSLRSSVLPALRSSRSTPPPVPPKPPVLSKPPKLYKPSVPAKPQWLKTSSRIELFYSSLSANRFQFKSLDPAIHGRDSAVVQLEQAFSNPDKNICIIQGRGGSGKSLFSRHVCDWWKSTSFIQDFFLVDFRKVAMVKSAEYDHDHSWCTVEKMNFVEQALYVMFKAIWPDKVSRKLYGKSKSLTMEQSNALTEELRSRKYLIVFDNADFPLCLKDDMITSTAVMTTGSGLNCRESMLASCSAMQSLLWLLAKLNLGQSKIIITTRFKSWITDLFTGPDLFYFQLPEVTLVAALSIAQGKLNSLAANKKIYEYPGVNEHLAAIIDLLQYNPLSIEVVLGHMVKHELTPKEIQLKICTEAFILDEQDASLAFAGGGRFVSELQLMTGLDWNAGVDESRRPFSMFWVSSCLGYLPSTTFWLTIVDFLFQMWNRDLNMLDLALDREESEVCKLMAKLDPRAFDNAGHRVTEEEYHELTQALGLEENVSDLHKIMEQAGVVETEVIDDNLTEQDLRSASSHHRVHPLFTLVARGATWGYNDEEHLATMRDWARGTHAAYVLSSYQLQFRAKTHMTPQSYMTGGELLNTPETKLNWQRLLQRTFKDLSALVNAVMWAATVGRTGKQLIWWSQSPQLLRPTIWLISIITTLKRDSLYPVSEALELLYRTTLQLVDEDNSFLTNGNFVGCIVQLASCLANLSAHRDGLSTPLTYYNEARDAVTKYKAQVGPQGTSPVDIEFELRMMDTSEAEHLCLQGDREEGSQKQKQILTDQPPSNIPQHLRILYLIPALCGWLNALTFRDETFPNLHQLIQIKQPIEDILKDHDMWLDSEARAFSEDVQSLFQKSVHEIISMSSGLPVPPPNKRFDSRYLQIYGDAVGDAMVNGLGKVHRSAEIDAETEASLLKAFLLQSSVAGSSGNAAVHMRAASLLVGSGQWVEALRHLKSYAVLPTPQEDRLNPSLRCQNALLAVLCFGKLECWELARQHAFKAVEEAVLARDDGQCLILSLGALAGLEAGRISAPTLMAKLLILKASQVSYSSYQPGRIEGGPSAYQLKTRNGYRFRIMTTLGSLIPEYGCSHHPIFLPMMIKQRLVEREEAGEVSLLLPGVELVEAAMDATVLMISTEISRLKEEANAGRMFWVDEQLEKELWAEAEQIAFGTEPPELKHMANSPLVEVVRCFPIPDGRTYSKKSQYDECRTNIQRCLALITTHDGQVDLESLRDALTMPEEPLSFDPPASAITEYEAKRAAKGDDSDSELSVSEWDDEDDIESGYLTFKMFWDHATEHLLATELQDTPVPDEIWRQMEKLFEKWELERQEVDSVPSVL